VTAGVRSLGGDDPGPVVSAAGRLLGRIVNRKNGLRFLSLVVVGGTWQAWGSANPFFASYPSEIFEAASRNLFPLVLPAFVTTLTALMTGLGIATPIGILVGFAMGRVRILDVALTPYINAIYATPRIALIPVLVLWLGIDFNLRVTIVALGAVFPIIVNTYAGAKHVDAELLDTGRSFMASNGQILSTIIMPSSVPYIFAGFRIGIGRAVSGVIVAEMTSALTGIGRLMIEDAKYLQIDEVFVSIMVLGIFSLLLFDVVARVQRWLTPWGNVERLR
jgi:ABC-type nitrate/sulfonate/bicarbonate transport system permease component